MPGVQKKITGLVLYSEVSFHSFSITADIGVTQGWFDLLRNNCSFPQCSTCKKGVSLKRNDQNLLFLGFFGWFIDLSLPAKIAVIAGTVVFLIAVCCGCCCYLCCCRRRSANQGPIIIAPGVGTSAVMATNANTRVPMRPLVEEE